MENAIKHTPGPWHIGVRQPNSDKFIYGQDGSEVANCDMLTNFHDVNLANARLIAAAPDMLEALEKAASILEDEYQTTDCRHPSKTGLYAVIAKAKGENP